MLYTIYCHTHVESGRRYIGLTKHSMLKRWNRHVYAALQAKKGKRPSHFCNAIRMYGKEAFSHEVLEVCHSLDVANIAEECWIEFYDTQNSQNGFNLMRGGRHTPHPVRSPWDRPGFREKQAMIMKARFQDPGVRAMTAIRSREALSRPEVRKKLSEATTRQFASVESRNIMSAKVQNLHKDPEISKKFYSGFQRCNDARSSKTHCVNGHEFTPENTKTDSNGWRYCRKCASNRMCKKQYEERTSCINGHSFEPGSFKFKKDGRQRVCLKCHPSRCVRGHDFIQGVNPKPGKRGCHPCRLERSRVYDAARRQARRIRKESK